MIPVLTETVDACAVCDRVCSEADLEYVETDEEAEELGVPIGSMVCVDCSDPDGDGDGPV